MRYVALTAAALMLTACAGHADLRAFANSQAGIAEIRREVYAQTDVAAGQERLFEPYPRTYDELLEIYSANGSGVWCAGAAYTLQKAYEAAGYESWVLSYGFIEEPGYLTHASTLVRVGDEIYLQDAYLNFDYPVPLDDVIDGLVMRQPVAPRTDTAERDVLVSDGQVGDSWAVSDPRRCSAPSEADGVRLCRSKTTLQSFIDGYSVIERDLDEIASYQLPRDLRYLLMFPYAIFDGVAYIDDPAASPLLAEIVERLGPFAKTPLIASRFAAGADATAAAVQ